MYPHDHKGQQLEMEYLNSCLLTDLILLKIVLLPFNRRFISSSSLLDCKVFMIFLSSAMYLAMTSKPRCSYYNRNIKNESEMDVGIFQGFKVKESSQLKY